MIQITPRGESNAIGITAVGKLTDSDYKESLIPAVERLIEQHGNARVLFLMGPDFAGWELPAAWDDAIFGIKHRQHIEKCAVVGGPKWVEWLTKVVGSVMKGEVKTFDADEITQAWEWIDQ